MSGPFSPQLLQRLPEPFDHPDFLFELKYDGFRSLAFITNRECRLMSRNNNPFRTFDSLAERMGKAFKTTHVILDGEICCVDDNGAPQFKELLFRRGEPVYFAFDLIYCNGIDWREQPLIKRKERLREVLGANRCDRILYVDQVLRSGVAVFEKACELDLEGIVAKHRLGKYVRGRDESTWFKIRNRAYLQWVGRDKLFERTDERQRPGWDVCSKAASAVAGL